MKNKYKILILTIIILILLIYITNLHFPLRSYIAMYPLSSYYKNTGSFDDIALNIPSGSINNEDFYPFMLYFNSHDGFANYVGSDADLSIAYNFGSFEAFKEYSSYYDRESSLFSSFYGAYIIDSKENETFGFDENDKVDVDLLAKVPAFDQKHLVLSSLGLSTKKSKFKNDIIAIKEYVDYIDIEGWVKIDSNILTNSPNHNKEDFHLGYIQFGQPKYQNVNFPDTNLYGRMYVKYFKEYDKTIGFYILGKSKKIVNQIDEEITSKSSIN